MRKLLTSPRVAASRQRVRTGLRPIIQTGLAAGLAWFVASTLIGYDDPFFAPIAAVIALGTAAGRRGRRAIEMVVGVAVGIAVADLIILGLGTGFWQITVVVVLAMTAATAVSRSPLLGTQAAVSAVLVATLEPPMAGLVPHRFFHALIGGIVAVLVAQVLLPMDPVRSLRQAAAPVFEAMSDSLERIARALADGDLARAREALDASRAIDPQVRALHDTLAAADETAHLSPLRRDEMAQVDSYANVATQVDLAVRNTRVLARAAIAVLRRPDASGSRAAPPALVEAVEELARGVRSLGEQAVEQGPQMATRYHALKAVDRASLVLPDPRAVALGRVVGQVRGTVVDLLRCSGMDAETALSSVDEASSPPEDPPIE
ncbi:aromatic acid exporter family protein [Egibacter rhizosphaerae]|uniref:Aromatic acid exporter family protein n=1 Tax=Egibacter rhizosphaerae TaxID=1670831 RepID=A0A411YFC3_9ACTN|nr:FUSC family protein [Egibacter rhizosphaerae]QBI19935.1 aromatic acid exporter family protein [Egibacter rhizosphaerae]